MAACSRILHQTVQQSYSRPRRLSCALKEPREKLLAGEGRGICQVGTWAQTAHISMSAVAVFVLDTIRIKQPCPAASFFLTISDM